MAVEPQGSLDRGDEGGPFPSGGEGAGRDEGEPAGDLVAAGPASRAPRSSPIPEYTKVDGSLSEKYFRVSDASAPARVVMSRLCSSSTMIMLTRVSRQMPQTCSITSVMLARRGTGSAEKPGDLHGDHLAGRGRRDGDVDDGDVVAGARSRVPVPVGDLDGLAELGDRRGLPGPGRPGHHEPGPPVMGEAVHPDQVPALGDDPPDDRGLDHDQPGMVLQPLLVVGGALAVLERRASPAREAGPGPTARRR